MGEVRSELNAEDQDQNDTEGIMCEEAQPQWRVIKDKPGTNEEGQTRAR